MLAPSFNEEKSTNAVKVAFQKSARRSANLFS